MKTFSSTGAKAAAANLRWALSVPDCSVTRTMQNRYGKVMRVMATARANLAGSASKPGASNATSVGVNSSARTSTTNCDRSRMVKIWLAKPPAAPPPFRSRTRE